MPHAPTTTVEDMFVQTACGVRTDDGTMTLLGLTPHTIYFSDRPERIVGHITTHRTPPTHAGPGVLFIDPLGRPLSPMSVAGVRRRENRQERRRF